MRPFTLVLAGGGARGYAHLGVLRALELWGVTPTRIVGVSMGAIVAALYAVRDDWYEALVAVPLIEMDAVVSSPADVRGRARAVLRHAHTAWNLLRGWGAPEPVVDAARATLDELFGGARLEAGRIPVTVCATDLVSGERVELSSGPAARAAYASSALAGVFPPLVEGGRVLADGVYCDIAPVDIARRSGAPVVVVDPRQPAAAATITNGLGAVMRAMEVCQQKHASLRIDAGDLVIRPTFPQFVDVLDFGARRPCIAAGVRAARARRPDLSRLLRETAAPGRGAR